MTDDGANLPADTAEALAMMHRANLLVSVLGRIGQPTVERYYRWVGQSANERLFVAHDEGAIAGAAVLSLVPGSVIPRFVAYSPMAFVTESARAFARDAAFRREVRAFLFDRSDDVGSELPEVLQIFVAASKRGRGTGTQLLLRVEEWLRMLRLDRYCVRTLADGNAATLSFYARCGFQPVRERVFCGERYVVLEKRVS